MPWSRGREAPGGLGFAPSLGYGSMRGEDLGSGRVASLVVALPGNLEVGGRIGRKRDEVVVRSRANETRLEMNRLTCVEADEPGRVLARGGSIVPSRGHHLVPGADDL